MTRLGRAWQALDPERRLAAVAAVALLLTMFLPWYQQNGVADGSVVSRDLNAFAVFSFLEGAILLTALAVLLLLFVRAERRELPLPEKDGSLVLLAGGFVLLLLFIRLFDKPGVSGKGTAVDVGVQWGIFFALAAAGLLAYAGARLRAAQQEPPLLRGRVNWRGPSGGAGPRANGPSQWRAQAAPGARRREWRRAPLALPPAGEDSEVGAPEIRPSAPRSRRVPSANVAKAGPKTRSKTVSATDNAEAATKVVSATDARPKRQTTAARRRDGHADQLSFEDPADNVNDAADALADAAKPSQGSNRP